MRLVAVAAPAADAGTAHAAYRTGLARRVSYSGPVAPVDLEV